MDRISFLTKGSTSRMENFLQAANKLNIANIVRPYAEQGVTALAQATPRDTGKAASSWNYKIETKGGSVTIVWTNSDVEDGFPVAIMLQYGYGTGTGGYVAGRDYINPAVRPIFDDIAEAVWKVVTSS